MIDKPMRQQSWRDNRQWQYGRVTSSASRDMWIRWLFTAVLVAFSVPLLGIALPEEMAKGNRAALFVLAFPLAGVWGLVQAIVKTLEWRRFGRLVLELDPFPGSLGGEVGGWVELPVHFDGESRYEVILSCVHCWVSGSGRHRTRHEEVVWRDEAVLVGEFGTRGTRVRFCFSLPEELPETEPPSDDYHSWAVHLKAKLPGIDLDRSFELPVFETLEPRRARYRPSDDASANPADLPRHIVRVSRTAEGLRLDYPASRNRGAGLGLSGAGLLFVGLPLFMALNAGESLFGQGDLLVPVLAFGGLVLLVFGLVGMTFVIAGLYLLANSLQVLAGLQHLATRRKLLGIPVRWRQVPNSRMTAVEHRISGQTGRGARATVRYALHGTLDDGTRIPLGDGLRGRALADQVVSMIRQACGLPDVEAPDASGISPGTDDGARNSPVAGRWSVRWLAALAGTVTIGVSAYELLRKLPR